MSYIAKIMSDKEGRKFINELMSFCGLYHSGGAAEDLLRMDGKKQVGLYILSQVQENNRSQLYVMQEEAYLASKEKENEQRKSAKRSSEDHHAGIDFDASIYFGAEGGGHDSGEGLNL